MSVEKVRFYPGTIPSNSKLHVIIGHSTVMARVQFFGTPRTAALDSAQQDLQAFNVASLIPPPFDFSRQYLFQEELYGPEGRPARAEGGTPAHDSIAKGQEFATSELPPHYGPQWALFHFEEPVTAPTNALVIGARLDADLNAAACRIAVSGRMRALLDPSVPEDLRRLRVYKLKAREGMIERVEADGCTAVCKGMFGKDSDLSRFVGMEVQGPEGQKGVLEGSFGKSGKFKVRFQQPIRIDKNGPAAVVLLYKRFLYDPDKRRIAQ